MLERRILKKYWSFIPLAACFVILTLTPVINIQADTSGDVIGDVIGDVGDGGNDPEVDLRINGLDGPVPINFGSAGDITWTGMFSTGDSVGEYTSLEAIDSSTIFVSYRDITNTALKFAKSTDGGLNWTYVLVDNSANVGYYTSLRAVNANNIFISYYDTTNKNLKFARSSDGGTTWTVSNIDTAGTVGRFSSIDAVDANTIFISYFADTNGNLKFAKSTDGGTTWTISIVDSGGNVGAYTSIDALDANNIFISYRDSTNTNLKFARSSDGGTTWTVSTADNVGNVGAWTSMRAPNANTIFIAHQNVGSSGVSFTKSTDGGLNWTTTNVDTVGNKGNTLSLDAIDANNIFISYRDSTNLDLNFAKSTDGGSTWTINNLESTSGTKNAGEYSSIDAIDANTIFTSFYYTTNSNLYVSKSTDGGTAWTRLFVDGGPCTALAIPFDPDWTGNKPENSTAPQSTGPMTVNTRYEIICEGGIAQDFVDVNVVVPLQPDYITEGLGVAPGGLIAGQLVTFAATVKNAPGSGAASASSATRLRLDVDDGISGNWVSFPNQTTGALTAAGSPGDSEVENWTNAWTAQTGTHLFEVCADIGLAVTESNEGNNCSTQTFSVGAALTPNLVITSFTIPNGTPGAGGSASVTIQNTGTAATPAGFEVGLHDGSPSIASISCSDEETGVATALLSSGASRSVSIPFIYPAAGSYTARAMVDSDCAVSESDEGDNAASAVYTVSVITQPDYVAEGLATAGPVPGPITAGQSVTFAATVRNNGTGAASVSSATRLRLDVDDGISGNWVSFPNQTTGALTVAGSPGDFEVENWTNAWTAQTGTHLFEVCADIGLVVTESNEGNNCSTQTFAVGVAPEPDLTVGAVITVNGALIAGQTLTFTNSGVVNIGTANAGASTARFCIDNANCLISSTGQVNAPSIGVLTSGGGSSGSITSSPWTAITGPHTVYFCADVLPIPPPGSVTESNENNNCAGAGTSFTIGAAFDFSLSNNGNVSVTQGYNTSRTINAALDSGTTQSVSFAITSAPILGVSYSFSPSPASCNPACSKTLDISTSGSTPAGAYLVTVTGTSGSLTRTTTFTLTVNAQTLLISSLNVVPNPADPGVSRNITATRDPASNAQGTINYSFWWNCNNASTDVSTVSGACGALPADAAGGGCTTNSSGAKCNGESAISMTVSRTYSVRSTAKVILEQGAASPAERRTTVNVNLSASCSANPIIASMVDDTVRWTAFSTGGSGSYTFLWSGDAPLGGKTSNPYDAVYPTSGQKTGSVTVNDGFTSVGPIACTNSPITITGRFITFDVNPTPINTGEPTTVSWTTEGFTPTGCTLTDNNPNTAINGGPVSTSCGIVGFPACPVVNLATTTIFTLVCDGISRSATAIVRPPPSFIEIPPP